MWSRNAYGPWGVVLAAVLMVAGCGGGGGDDSNGGRNLARDITGTWTFTCSGRVGEWRNETLSFDPSTGTVTHARLQFGTPDCSDPPVTVGEEKGAYATGETIGCASGSGFRCTELDIMWEDGDQGYAAYSVYEDEDPKRLLLSDVGSEPAQRPDDVDPAFALKRIAFPGKYGLAVLDVYLRDGGAPLFGGSEPPSPNPGYEVLPIDLNGGTGGDYIWLYYRLGRADGLDGTPLGEIYTVDEYGRESPYKGGTKLPVNLNEGGNGGHDPLWLYKVKATDTIARCVVVANDSRGVTMYGPLQAEGQYDVVWVEEIIPNSLKALPPYPPDAQDLNEGESNLFYPLTDFIYIGFCAD